MKYFATICATLFVSLLNGAQAQSHPPYFALYNSETNGEIRMLSPDPGSSGDWPLNPVDMDIITLSEDGDKLNIEFNGVGLVASDYVGQSCLFLLVGENGLERQHCENNFPFFLAANVGDDVWNWTPTPGSYVLAAMVFDDSDCKGGILTSLAQSINLLVQE